MDSPIKPHFSFARLPPTATFFPSTPTTAAGRVNIVPSPPTAFVTPCAKSAMTSFLDAITAERRAVPHFSGVSLSQLLLASFALILVIVSEQGKSVRRSVRTTGTKDIKSDVAVCVMGVVALRYALLAVGLALSTDAGRGGLFGDAQVAPAGVRFARVVYDVVADTFNSWTVAILQLAVLAMLKVALGIDQRINTPSRSDKVYRFLAFWAQSLTITAITIAPSGHDGEEADYTFRLGFGRRFATVFQSVSQLLVIALLVPAYRRISKPSSSPSTLQAKTRTLYGGQAIGMTVLLTICLFSLLSRAFPPDDEVSRTLQAPLFVFWCELVVLLALNTSVDAHVKLEEAEAKDEGLIRLGDEEKGVAAHGDEGAEPDQDAKKDDDEDKVELLIDAL